MDSITNKLSLFDGPSIGREEAKAYIDSLILPNIYSTHKLINLIPHKTATFISWLNWIEWETIFHDSEHNHVDFIIKTNGMH